MLSQAFASPSHPSTSNSVPLTMAGARRGLAGLRVAKAATAASRMDTLATILDRAPDTGDVLLHDGELRKLRRDDDAVVSPVNELPGRLPKDAPVIDEHLIKILLVGHSDFARSQLALASEARRG